MSNGFTGDTEYKPAGIVHQAEHTLKCTCGGFAWVTEEGDLVTHSEPVDPDAEHVINPFWREEIWRYELVE